MNSEPSRRLKYSGRMDDNVDRTTTPNLDFTLYGSPAPRCSHRATPIKMRRLLQPPNTPNSCFKGRKSLQLPIEKILVLSEKIEKEKQEKIKLELSPRQIKLQPETERELRNEDERCLLGFQKVSSEEEEGELSSSTIDLSIDLSTVTNSDHESDSTSEDEADSVSRPVMVKRRICSASSTATESPSRYVWRLNSNVETKAFESEGSSDTSYPCSPATGALCNDSCNTTNRSSFSQENLQPPHSPKYFRSRSADLIHLYVNTVNNPNKLTKYFRPCHVCNETCCVCPDLVPESSRSFSVHSAASRGDSSMFNTQFLRNGSLNTDYPKGTNDRMVETDPKITEFLPETSFTVHSASEVSEDKLQDTVNGPRYEQPRPNSQNSEFSDFLVERYLNKRREEYGSNEPDMMFDSGTSTLQLDDINDSDRSPRTGTTMQMKQSSKNRIPSSMMQLATAAQCARILANSLESVLEVVDVHTDYLQGRDFVRFKGEDLNQLFETILSLKAHFSQEQTKFDGMTELDHQMKSENGKGVNVAGLDSWVGFSGEESSGSSRSPEEMGEKPTHLAASMRDRNIEAAFRGPRNVLQNEAQFGFEDNFEGECSSEM